MKTIGLLGGMSWESTVSYYKAINEGVKESLGGLHSASIAMVSVDFEPIEKLQHAGDWRGAAKILCDAAVQIEAAGADCLLICTNTMHKVADDVEQAISIPLIHIADATGATLVQQNVAKVGLLGTGFTMDQPFYKERLSNRYDLEVLVPNEQDRSLVHQVIYDELCLGQIHQASRTEYLRIINDLSSAGAEAVILGCTEIALLVDQKDTPVPLYDTTRIHAEKAVEFALS